MVVARKEAREERKKCKCLKSGSSTNLSCSKKPERVVGQYRKARD